MLGPGRVGTRTRIARRRTIHQIFAVMAAMRGLPRLQQSPCHHCSASRWSVWTRPNGTGRPRRQVAVAAGGNADEERDIGAQWSEFVASAKKGMPEVRIPLRLASAAQIPCVRCHAVGGVCWRREHRRIRLSSSAMLHNDCDMHVRGSKTGKAGVLTPPGHAGRVSGACWRSVERQPSAELGEGELPAAGGLPSAEHREAGDAAAGLLEPGAVALRLRWQSWPPALRARRAPLALV